jgi:hypothetical protein
MNIVGLETDARVLKGIFSIHELGIANMGEKYREVPRKNRDVQVWVMRNRVAEKLLERARALFGIVFHELCPGIEIPCEQRDPPLRTPYSFGQGHVVVCAVNQQRKTIHSLNAPTIAPCLENTGHNLLCNRLRSTSAG